MWGAAPRLRRLALVLAVAAATGLAFARPASAATNWAANASVDFDADHKTDFGSLYRGRSPQDGLWYAPSSSGGGPFQIYFGATTDIAVPGDYDGDGRTDAAIWRPSSGLWYGPRTAGSTIVIQMILGQSGDTPVPGDYDGDGRTDPAIYRPSNNLFFVVLSGGGTLSATLGQAGDVAVPRDYDGDGKTDPAVYRPSNGLWQAQLSGGGTYQVTNGTAGDVPVPADFNGDGRADPVVFRQTSGLWTGPYNGVTGTYSKTLGQTGDVPIPGYYDANAVADPAIYRPGNGTWLATLSGGGTKRFDGLGLASDVAIQVRPGLVLPPPPSHEYFGTLSPGSAVPRSDADCASRVTRNPWEPRPENNTANHTVPSGPVAWNNNSSWTYWSAFIARRNKVTGNFTGTTDEIIQWAACKWGIDENLIRAEAVVESYWVQSHEGDFANGRYHSFGLMQVSQDDANGNLLKGGYPNTVQNTALNVDYYGAEIRACYEGDFWDGGGWLYGAAQVKGDLWGCVGYWYSGNWYDAGAQNYINTVKNTLNQKPWIAWGYPGK